LKNFDKPVLGICGGSHIIGLILGNKLKNKKEIGLKEINVKKEFLGIKGKRKVYHLHKFYSLPEIFNHQNFYATLFHPEVRNKEMIRNFCNL
jgi:GMP synthase-like glutamine amidotransferase